MTSKQVLDVPLQIRFPLPDGRTLVQGPLTYNQDGLATQHNCDFIRQPRFVEAYRVGVQGGRPNLHLEWRVHVALWVATQAAQLDGDFVECGVHTGVLSGAVMSWLNFGAMTDRTFYLLDTFEGIPEEQISEGERRTGVPAMNRKYPPGDQTYLMVKEKFARWPNAKVVRGMVPDTLSEIKSSRVAYASIDMNVAKAEIAALEFLWARLAPGALVLLDDYGWAAHVHQKLAFDDFANRRNVVILSLPTGQALIMKPR